jgi:hypothetical protein
VAIVFLVTAFTHAALIGMVNGIATDQRLTLGAGLVSGLRGLMILLPIEFVLMIPTWIILSIAFQSVPVAFLIDLGRPGGLQANSVLAYTNDLLSLLGLAIATNLVATAIGIGAERNLVIEQRSFRDSLFNGWQLLRTKFMDFVGFTGALMIVEIGISIALALAGQQILTSLGFDLSDPNLQIDPNIMLSTPLGAVLLGAQILVTTLLTVLSSSVWTLAYLEWQNPAPVEVVPAEKSAGKKKNRD